MSWLKIDPGLRQNPKWLALTRPQRAIWIEALCWVADYRAHNGELPSVANHAVPGLKQARTKFRAVGLLDTGDIIHDWILHGHGTIEDKVIHYLRQHPNASANEVASQIRGNRNQILALVKQYQDTTTDTSTEPVPEPVSRYHPDTGTRAPALPLLSKEQPSVTETAPIERRTHEQPKPGNGDGPDSDIDLTNIIQEM